jgi:hypothetical protein
MVNTWLKRPERSVGGQSALILLLPVSCQYRNLVGSSQENPTGRDADGSPRTISRIRDHGFIERSLSQIILCDKRQIAGSL